MRDETACGFALAAAQKNRSLTDKWQTLPEQFPGY
jgi:hypothetical protein